MKTLHLWYQYIFTFVQFHNSKKIQLAFKKREKKKSAQFIHMITKPCKKKHGNFNSTFINRPAPFPHHSFFHQSTLAEVHVSCV